MRKHLLFLVSFLTVSNHVYGQSKQIADSLESVLNSKVALVDTAKFNLYWDLSYYHPNPESALQYADSANLIGLKLNDKLMIAKANEMLGVNNRLLGNKVKAIEASYKALSIYEQLNKQPEIAHCMLQIGEFYYEDENYPEAINFMERSIAKFDSLGKLQTVAFAAINLGEAYRLNGALNKAIASFMKALALVESLTDNQEIVLGYAKGNLGMAFSKKADYQDALMNLNEAIIILQKLGDFASVSIYMAEKGKILLQLGEEHEGLATLHEGFQLAKDYNLKKPIRDISEILTKHYESTEEYEKAWLYQKEFQIYQDSLVNADNIRKTEQIRSGYEIDKKELEIENLSIQNELKSARIIQILIAIVLITILAIILLMAYRGKRKANILLNEKNLIISRQIKEKELLHQEIHHRVKNNLQLVSSIMGLQSKASENTEVSSAMSTGKSRVDAMTIIHQSLFRQKNEPSVDMQQYISKLVGNLTATHRDQLSEITTDVEPIVIDADIAIPIGLIVNEAICNAVKYQKVNHLRIDVLFRKAAEGYILSICDNGGGFLDQAKSTEGSNGFGTRLISTLARQLKASCEISSDQTGVKVELAFII